MANPYEWSDGRDDPREQDARREARRHTEQERMRPPHRQGEDYGAGGYGQDAADFDRYDRDDWRKAGPRADRSSFDAEAKQIGRGIERGWRRLSEGVRRAFEEQRPADDHDPRRGGGMFGGEDRRGSLFSHRDGLGGRPVGPHRGKGPKGYVRSDERIIEEISDRLSEDGRLDASDIEIKVDVGEVTLNGQVASREDKRRAEDLAEQVSGVKHLQNNLRVRPPEPPAAAPAARATPPEAAPPPRPN